MLPPVFELVAATAHRAVAFKWVRLPYCVCSQKRKATRWVVFLFWSRIRESKATKHIDIQLFFAFVAEIVAEYFLKNCKNQYQNGGMFHTSRHIFHSE